jgi:hypothetical protein
MIRSIRAAHSPRGTPVARRPNRRLSSTVPRNRWGFWNTPPGDAGPVVSGRQPPPLQPHLPGVRRARGPEGGGTAWTCRRRSGPARPPPRPGGPPGAPRPPPAPPYRRSARGLQEGVCRASGGKWSRPRPLRGRRSHAGPCWTRVSRMFTTSTMASRMNPRAMAVSKLPRRVSSTMAVVRTRVSPAMLPPTIMAAPTSEMTAPKPAIMAARIPRRASRTCIQSDRARLAPAPGPGAGRRRGPPGRRPGSRPPRTARPGAPGPPPWPWG